MKPDIRQHAYHALFSLLLSAGIVLTMLGILELLSFSLLSILFILLITVLLECISLSRTIAIISSSVSAILLLIWLFLMDGLQAVSDVAIAVSLHSEGIRTALPLISSSVVLLFTVPVSVLSFFITSKRASSWPSLMICGAILLLIWLSDRPGLLLYLLPSLIAAFCTLLLDRHDELSMLRVIPFVTVIVVLSFILTPSDGVIIPSWKEKADLLRQNIMDRFFYTDPRDVFSLSSEGYYPNGINQLGGTVTPTDDPVMQVSAPRNVYLRGVTMNEYNGRCWKNSLGGRRYLWFGRTFEQKRKELFDSDLPVYSLNSTLTQPYSISVRMLSDSASTLFTPQRIRELDVGGELVPYFSNSSELFVTRNLQTGDTYKVTAPLFVGGDSGLGILVDASSSAADPHWETILKTYTELPAHLEAPVWQIAHDRADGLSSSYDKAFAIQSWLCRNCIYRTDVDEHPENIDFVTDFLINTREGYCTYFASAMTVLCRMAGLPARYVEGYLAEPNENGEALVTGKNAHAWTEIYFKGFGWVTFDATPRNQNSESPEPGPLQTPVPTPSPAPDKPDDSSPSETPETEHPHDTPTPDPADPQKQKESDDSNTSVNSAFPWWLVLALLSALFILRVLLTSPLFHERNATAEKRFDVWAQEITDLLFSAGIRRRPSEAPITFVRRITAENDPEVSLLPYGTLLSMVHYGSLPPSDRDADILKDIALQLKSGLSMSQKIRYLLRRIFTSQNYRSYTELH